MTNTAIVFDEVGDQAAFEAACQRLRHLAPVVCVELPDGLKAWVVTRHAEGRLAMLDPRLVKDLRSMTEPHHGLGGRRYAEDIFVVEGRHMLNTDAADHARLRKVVATPLSADAIARRREETEQVCHALVDEFAGEDEVDLMDVYARPVPEIMMARVLGMADGTAREAAALSRKLSERRSPTSSPMRRLYHELVDLVVDCTSDPAVSVEGTVIEALHCALAAGQVSRREFVSTVMMLLTAGTSSTTIAIGHGAGTLMSTASTLRGLLATVPDTGALVDELLRHHPPFPFSPWRFAREKVEIGGVTIPAGAVVFVLLAATSRDPELADDADELRPGRPYRVAHLTFGHGPHFCIGAHLARLEISVALRVLFERLPQVNLARPYEDLPWQGLLFDRTITTMPVRPDGQTTPNR